MEAQFSSEVVTKQFAETHLGVKLKSVDFDNPDSKSIMEYILNLVVDDDAYENFMKQMKKYRQPIKDKYNKDYVDELLIQIREHPEQISRLIESFLMFLYTASAIDYKTIIKNRSFKLRDDE